MTPVKARNLLNASRNICNARFELQQAGEEGEILLLSD